LWGGGVLGGGRGTAAAPAGASIPVASFISAADDIKAQLKSRRIDGSFDSVVGVQRALS
jgi:hypothetical protein